MCSNDASGNIECGTRSEVWISECSAAGFAIWRRDSSGPQFYAATGTLTFLTYLNPTIILSISLMLISVLSLKILFPTNFVPASITIRGQSFEVASQTWITSVDIGSQQTSLGNVSFADLSFSGPSSSYPSYKEAIVTSSSSSSLVNALSFERCVFAPAPNVTSAATVVVTLAIVNQSLSFDSCQCTVFPHLVGLTSGSRGLPSQFDSNVQRFTMTNTSLPSYGCAVYIPASKRLVRDVARITANFINSDASFSRSWTSTRDNSCHSLQGYTRVEITGNQFVRDLSSLSSSPSAGRPSDFCLHLKASRFVLSQNNMSSVAWVRISSDSSVALGNNSLAPLYAPDGTLVDFPTVSPDLDCSKSNLNLRMNWWGYVDGPRLTQYNGTYRETYFPWFVTADQTQLASDCSGGCTYTCDYTKGTCLPVQLDQLTIIGISVTSSFAATIIALIFFLPYCRFYCCRPPEFR